jgi:hypothetical protein
MIIVSDTSYISNLVSVGQESLIARFVWGGSDSACR